MLYVIMLSVYMLSVVAPILLSVIMLSVVAPQLYSLIFLLNKVLLVLFMMNGV